MYVPLYRVPWKFELILSSWSIWSVERSRRLHRRTRYRISTTCTSMPESQQQSVRIRTLGYQPGCLLFNNITLFSYHRLCVLHFPYLKQFLVHLCPYFLVLEWYDTDYSAQSRFLYWSLGSCGSLVLVLVPWCWLLLPGTRVTVQGFQGVTNIFLILVPVWFHLDTISVSNQIEP